MFSRNAGTVLSSAEREVFRSANGNDEGVGGCCADAAPTPTAVVTM